MSLEINGIQQLSEQEAAIDFESMFDLDEGDEDGNENQRTPIEESPPPRLCETVCRCVTFPMILLFTFICIILIIIFCIFPGLFLVGSVVALYYCCSSDPIPIRVLLRALFASGGDEDGEQAIRSKGEIYEKLICRECLGTSDCDTVDCGDYVLNVEDHAALVFSKPMSKIDLLQQEERRSSILFDLESQQHTIETDAAVDGANGDDENCEHQQGQLPGDQDDQETADYGLKDSRRVVESQDEPLPEKGMDLDQESIENCATREEGGVNDEPSTGRKQNSTEDELISDEMENTATSRSILAEAAKLMKASPLEVEMATMARIESPAQPTEKLPPPDCDICLLPYEKGQYVAWSKNLSCSHCFHLDCIADWLVKHQSCPNCRAQYI